MSMVLRVTVSRCIACGKCELACAFAHGRNGVPGTPRIHVVRRDPAAERAQPARTDSALPLVCFQCEDAACVAVCPADALTRNAKTGGIERHVDRCLRCRLCVAACPFGNMTWDETVGYPEKCDLCGGEPRCTTFCSTGALQYLPAERASTGA